MPVKAKRFWAYVLLDDKDKCWVWIGPNQSGKHPYGRYAYAPNKWVSSHRYAYTLFNGEIPKGMVVRHRCDNPPCVNPHHLEIGTQGDNNRDTFSRGRNQKGNRKLSAEQVRSIWANRGIRTARSLASEFGVGRSTVLAVWCGQNKHKHALVSTNEPGT